MLLFAFAAVPLLAVLLSSLAHRTILSAVVLFLVAGFVLVPETTGVLDITAYSPIVATLAELALFTVLFTDGMRVGWADLRSAGRLPGRALGWGLPLTLLVTALLAHYVVGLDWPESLLLGAVLAPTDPVFAAALVGNERVPGRLRHLLNVESGINDGLALPFVILFLAVAAGSDDLHLDELGLELLLGVVIGVAVPWLALRQEKSRFFPPPPSTSRSTGWRSACWCWPWARSPTPTCSSRRSPSASPWPPSASGSGRASSTSATGRRAIQAGRAVRLRRAHLDRVPRGEISWPGWIFAVLAIVVARPVALAVSFLGSRLSRTEQFAAMWFGPKGLRLGGLRPAGAPGRHPRR